MPEPLTRQQFLRDLVRPTPLQLVLALMLGMVGFALTVQLGVRAEQQYANLRQEELVSVLDQVTGENRRLEAEVLQLERTREQLQSGVDASAVARDEAQRRLDALEILAGTVAAEGAGVRVTMTDPAGKVTPEIFLNAIEELRDAGAEVIEINDRVRLVASSWVAQGRGGLVFDGVEVAPPYVIEAIGDVDTLSEAVRFRGGLVSTIEGDRVGGQALVERVDLLQIQSVHEPVPPRFSRPG